MSYKWPVVIFTKFSNAGSKNRNDVGAGEGVCKILCSLALQGRNFLNDLLCHGNSRAAHTDGLTQSALTQPSNWHLVEHAATKQNLYQSYKCNTVPVTSDFYHLLPVVAAVCWAPFLSPIKRERWHSQKSRIRESLDYIHGLTQWIMSSHEFAHRLRDALFWLAVLWTELNAWVFDVRNFQD